MNEQSQELRTEKELYRLIEKSMKREDNDDHLPDDERQDLVNLYCHHNPDHELEGNLGDDFVNIIY
jgi:hypothetical protein|tara:strand:+ start:14670 stop:14867 length:198 start_codon:yes stop_codon:yes gene_type:complete